MDGPGCYLGYKIVAVSKDYPEVSKRKLFYPTYERWCQRNGIRPLSHVVFSQYLLECLNKEGFPSDKIKREKGIFITGVSIKMGVYDRDYVGLL